MSTLTPQNTPPNTHPNTQQQPKDPRKFQAALECLSFCDYSLAIKCGVHMTLCGGTICKLGTKRHHDAYLDGIDSLALPGCFSMTELGHGSNVMGIETTVRRCFFCSVAAVAVV
jgi:alkylation response protein AidB-like acyl-CoA dehydrogenase